MSTVVTLGELVGILETAVKSPGTIREQVALFLKTFRNAQTLAVTPPQNEVFRDLALDLEYFVPNSDHRREDPVYYGPSRALDEIRTALKALNNGVA